MKRLYRKKRIHYTLIFGIILFTVSLLGIFIKGNPNYWLLISSFFYLGGYFYEKNTPYLTIENGIINQPFRKRINLTEIKEISRKKAGYYILKTDKTELTIDTQAIDEKSFAELNAELEKLNVEWN